MNRLNLLPFMAPLCCVFLATPAVAQTDYGCDSSAIDWTLPGQFEQAWAKAKEQERLIIIKGISFGVDEAGAKCATKGSW